MSKHVRIFATLVAATALLAMPAAGQANQGKSKGAEKRCAKTPKVGYVVHGTLVSFTADDAATTAVNEAAVSVTVTAANRHASNSGEIADQDAALEGVQVAGATNTVTADPFTVSLEGFEGADTPSAGDTVTLIGKIARTKAKCAPEGTTTADRYAKPDVRKVIITDMDADV